MERARITYNRNKVQGTRKILEFLEQIAELRDESQPLVEIELEGEQESSSYYFHLSGRYEPSIDHGATGEPRVTLRSAREMFFQLVDSGNGGHWRSALESGEIEIEGDESLGEEIFEHLDRGRAAASS